MGKKVSYLRRKAISECFNPDNFSLINNPEICACTTEDYECDIGFSRNRYGGCYLSNGLEIDFTPPDDCNTGYYTVKKGYRKVAGNKCEGGLEHRDYQVPCPNEIKKIWIFVGMSVVIIFFIVLMFKFQCCRFIKDLGKKKRSRSSGVEETAIFVPGAEGGELKKPHSE